MQKKEYIRRRLKNGLETGHGNWLALKAAFQSSYLVHIAFKLAEGSDTFKIDHAGLSYQ